MENQLLILKSLERDLDELRMLYLTVRKEAFSWIETDSYELYDYDESTKDELVLVAKINYKVVGFVSIWEPEKFIHNLYIDMAYQGKGVGTALINEAIKRIGLPLTLKCMKENSKALRYYLKNNWQVIKEEKDSSGPYYLMQLNVTGLRDKSNL